MKVSHLAVVITFVLAVFGLTDPIDILMPTSIQMSLLILATLLFVFIFAFIFKEKPQDEREAHLLNLSSRNAFLAGTLVLFVGIINQSLTHTLDNWLVWAVSTMVIVKYVTLNKTI